nr:hypothetical protein GCM10020092_019730 [Actinoplanes digitatis]
MCPELVEELVGSRLFALGTAVALLAVAGCSDHRSEAASLPPVQIVQQPAASAGGACILWDYEFIEEKIGVRFSVAAADQVDITSTCVVQTEREEWPYLALSVVESTKADASTFAAENIPAKATKLKGLGKARLPARLQGVRRPRPDGGDRLAQRGRPASDAALHLRQGRRRLPRSPRCRRSCSPSPRPWTPPTADPRPHRRVPFSAGVDEHP